MTTTSINLHVEEYCVLCQRALALSQDNSNNNDKDNDDRLDSNKWEANVIAFFAGGSYDDESNGDIRLHIFSQPDLSGSWPGAHGRARLVLRSTTTRNRWVRVSFFGAQQEEKDDDDGGSFYPLKDSILYFVHICCWKVVNDRKPVSYRDLYRLAEAIRFILPRSFCGDAPAVPLQIEIPQEQESRDTHLTHLLSHVLNLPVELHRVILDYLDGGMVGSLLRARQTATLLEKLSSSSAPAFGGIQIQTLPLHANSHLSAKTIRLFGHTYLENVSVVETLVKFGWNTFSTRDAAVTAAKVYIGPLGVQGLMLVYADGSLSPVLGTAGSTASNLSQTIPFHANSDSSPPALHIRHDGLKVFYISQASADDKLGEHHDQQSSACLVRTVCADNERQDA